MNDAAILVVDDDDNNRFTLVQRLKREGYEAVTTANDGQEALALLSQRPFDLVLLDVMMPRLDGIGLLTAMKADPVLKHIPVIMISAVNDLDRVVRCIELGAEDYLPKPFNKVLLRARVGACLEKSGYVTKKGLTPPRSSSSADTSAIFFTRSCRPQQWLSWKKPGALSHGGILTSPSYSAMLSGLPPTVTNILRKTSFSIFSISGMYLRVSPLPTGSRRSKR